MTKSKLSEKRSRAVLNEVSERTHESREGSEVSERSERASQREAKRAKLHEGHSAKSMLSTASTNRTLEEEREKMVAEMATLKAEREALLASIEEEKRRLEVASAATKESQTDHDSGRPKPTGTKKNSGVVRNVSAPLPPTLKHVSADALGNLPTDAEIVIVNTTTPIADAVLEQYVAAVDKSALLKIVLTEITPAIEESVDEPHGTQRNGSGAGAKRPIDHVSGLTVAPRSGAARHVSQGFAAKLVTALRRASVTRLQDIVRTLKSYLAAHGQRTCCLACENARKSSKPTKKTSEDSKTGEVQAPAAAVAKCGEAACRETSAEVASAILATTEIEPLLAFARAKFPTVVALERMLGDRFPGAIMSESFDISDIDAAFLPIATRVINDLRTIHHKIIHVVEVEAEADGSYELDSLTSNVFVCGIFELYSNGSSEDRITFVHDRCLTPTVIADLEARYKKDRLQQRRNSRRASKKVTTPAGPLADSAAPKMEIDAPKKVDEPENSEENDNEENENNNDNNEEGDNNEDDEENNNNNEEENNNNNEEDDENEDED